MFRGALAAGDVQLWPLYLNVVPPPFSQVGHRRWVQRPNTKVMANGDAWPDKWGEMNSETGPLAGRSYWMPTNNQWVVDDSNLWSAVDPSAPILQLKPFPFFSWPPAGAFIPYHLVFPRWQFSLEGFGYEMSEMSSNFAGTNIFASAKVSMTVKVGSAAAKPLAVAVINTGRAHVVFEPSLNDSLDNSCSPPTCQMTFLKPPAADTVYTVTISGFSFKGATSVSYSFTVFNIPGAPIFDPPAASAAAAAEPIDLPPAPDSAIVQPEGWFTLGEAPALP
jgi:hypothetical protein